MTLILVSGPAELPVSVADVKLHTRIDSSEEDALVEDYIRSALEEIERKSGIAYMDQTWQWVGDAFPEDGIIDLGLGPVTAITSVTYYDESDAEQILDPAEYQGDTFSAVGRVLLVGSAWPATYERTDAVVVEFTAGRDVVPPSIRHAIMVMVAQAYDDRIGAREPFGTAARSLVSPHRRIVF